MLVARERDRERLTSALLWRSAGRCPPVLVGKVDTRRASRPPGLGTYESQQQRTPKEVADIYIGIGGLIIIVILLILIF